MNDLKFAFRQLLKNPGFTTVAVLTLALGIGANTTVYSWIHATLVNVLPEVREQDRLVVLCPQHQAGNLSDTCSYPDIQEFVRMTNVFSGVVGSQCGLAHLRIGRSVHWIWAQPFTASAFNVLGVTPVLGRGFLPEEEFQPGGHPVAVISYSLWQGKFGGDTNLLGRIIEVNQRPFTVVGVAPPAFLGTMGGCRMDLWVPVSMNRTLGLGPANLQQRNDRWMHTLARLQPGVSVAQAQAAVAATATQLESAYPDTNRDVRFRVLPLWKSPYGGQSGMRPLLQALGTMAAMVLLIVIANLSSLQLVRAADRAKEMAVRLALGARRRTILRQLLTESILLAGLGGGLGVLFSGWAVHSLRHFLPRTYMPISYAFSVDAGVLGLAVALSAATGVLFGLAPAWQAMHVNQVEALKEGGRAGSGAGARKRLRPGFVVTEIALVVPLLISAGLAYESFQFAKRENVGLDPNQVLVAGLRLESDGYDDTTGRVFMRKLRQRLAEIPGVESVTVGNWLPLGFEGGSTAGIHVDGYTESPGEYMSVGTSTVSPDYFKTFRIPVREGREFRESDDADATPVAIINEEVARRFFAGRSPIGAKIRYWGGERTVVGVVKNGKYRTLNEPQQPFVYAPYAQHYESHLGVAMRVAGDPYAFASQLRAAIKELNPAVEPFTMLSMADYTGAAYLLPRIASNLLMGVSVVTLFLSTLGIYGVMAYGVSQRTREIGIRIALGAATLDIYTLVLGAGLKLALTGVVIGLAASIALTRLMAGLLIGVTPTDPVTIAVVTVLLTLVALAACYLPARRAAKVDPIEALRYE